MDGPRISRSALARMTGATALGLAVAPEVAAARTRRSLAPPAASLGRARRWPRRRRRHGRRRARGRFRPRRAARDGQSLPGCRGARRPPRRRGRRARVRRAPRGHRRGDDDRHALRPRVDDEGHGNGDGRDAPRRSRQALAQGPGGEVPAQLRDERQGRRARTGHAALLVGAPHRQPEGRHRRHRGHLALHGGDAARVPDRVDGRVLRPHLPPARPSAGDGRRQGSGRLLQARDLGPAGHGRHDVQPGRLARRRAAPPPARARWACAPARCADRFRTTRTGRWAASSAATASSPLHATSRSSAR